jgi:hypothetical protein
MPSRNNVNLPKALNRRVLSHRRVAVRTKTRTANSKVILHRTAATDARPRGDAGVVRGGTISKKRAKKDARNKNFVLERKKEEAAEILLKEKKEVEMIGRLFCGGDEEKGGGSPGWRGIGIKNQSGLIECRYCNRTFV